MNKPKLRAWHLANTTIRNPFRLKGGLEALIAGGFEGNMSKAMEHEMARALDAAEIIALSKNTVDITSIARKWRSVLVKLGFLWPDVGMQPRIAEVDQEEIGAAFSLTTNGRRLLAAKSLQGVQEVILRSISALRLPSPLEPGYTFREFSPLNHVIRILDELQRAGNEPYISRLEMASIVILTNGEVPASTVATQIIQLRRQRLTSNSKRRFDGETIRAIALEKGQKHQTLYDYQDVTFRYLKATGLFQSRGRGIALVPEKSKLATLLASDIDVAMSAGDYLVQLARGADLPTDTQEGAAEVLADLLTIASDSGIFFETSSYNLDTPAGISLARHDLEALIFQAKEVEYASDQVNQIEEILAYLEILDENKPFILFEEEQLSIPKEERPAYFEWLLWRVLLALDHLVVPPNEVRRFAIDQDFLPVSTASGGGADVIGEYLDSVLVVEVTLTENSRQEAAEGEPVRRHVADMLEKFEPLGKAVYGLFIARRIDTNTAETFRIGVWYRRDDVKVDLEVVPLTLNQFRKILRFGVEQNKLNPSLLIDVILDVSLARSEVDGAPAWKKGIAELVETSTRLASLSG